MAVLWGGVEDEVEDHRGAAEVGDLMLSDEGEYGFAADLAQAHIGARHSCRRPSKAPTVAVEEGQSPQVHGSGGEGPVHEIGESGEVRAAVGEHHTLKEAEGEEAVE